MRDIYRRNRTFSAVIFCNPQSSNRQPDEQSTGSAGNSPHFIGRFKIYGKSEGQELLVAPSCECTVIISLVFPPF